jgi:hypothetical protein
MEIKMKKTIKKVVLDTDKASEVGYSYSGEFGHSNGFEERLYTTEKGEYFIYGVGGTDSPYNEPAIYFLTKEEADEWKQRNLI